MAPDVLLRKLTYLRKLLDDLAPYKNASFAQVEAEHYKLERLLELMVMAATDILNHLLAERGQTAVSYKSAFQLAAKEGMIPVNYRTACKTPPVCATCWFTSTKKLITKSCTKASPPHWKILPNL